MIKLKKTEKTTVFVISAAVLMFAVPLLLTGCKQEPNNKESKPVAVTGVRLDNTELNLVKGSKGKLSATVLPSSASNKNVSWTSDNPAVAEVDQNGNVTAKAPGSAVITVKTDDGGKTAACTVTVTAKAEKNRAILTLGIKKDIKIKAVTGDGSAVTVEGCSETSLASGIEKVLQASGEKVILKGKITELYCNGNELQHINVKDLTGLTYLSCSSNNLTALDVQGLTALGTLNCLANKITSLNLQGLTALKALNCSSNILTSLDIQDLKALQILNCASNNLTDLDVQGLTSLKDIFCVENRITALNLQGLTDLQSIHCGRNRLVTLDAQNSAYLNILDCQDNQLTSLNVQNCPSLEQLNCFGNKLDKDAFKNLFEGMHNRKGINQGECVVYTEDGTENNYKGFTPDELKSVKDKNWKIIKITKDGNTDEL